jgi:hypothetical protein
MVVPCTTCRRRKLKCQQPDSIDQGQPTPAPCELCVKHGFSCSLVEERQVESMTGGPESSGRPILPRPMGSGSTSTSTASIPIVRAKQARSRSPPVGLAKMASRPEKQVSYLLILPFSADHQKAPYSSNYMGTDSRRRNPIESLMPRSLVLKAVDTYFQCVYCLVPIVHRPSFLNDLEARREELPHAEEWMALLLGVVAVTLAQVPWAFAPMTKKEVKGLVGRCYLEAKRWAQQDTIEITTTRCVVTYLYVHLTPSLALSS